MKRHQWWNIRCLLNTRLDMRTMFTRKHLWDTSCRTCALSHIQHWVLSAIALWTLISLFSFVFVSNECIIMLPLAEHVPVTLYLREFLCMCGKAIANSVNREDQHHASHVSTSPHKSKNSIASSVRLPHIIAGRRIVCLRQMGCLFDYHFRWVLAAVNRYSRSR